MCWAALAVAVLVTCVGTLRHDYRDATLVGDQASQLMQAVSLAHGGNLSYDAADLAHYDDATWRVRYRPPAGLLFQRDGDGWAFAKPYGYSLVVAPFLRVLGPTRGVAVANTLLLLAVLAVASPCCGCAWTGPAVPLTAPAIVLVSNVVPYAYVLYVELFTAVVVGLAAYGLLRAARDGTTWAALLGFGGGRPGGGREVDARARARPARGGGAGPAAGPAGQAARARRGRRSCSASRSCRTGGYSDGQTFSPYGGERYTTSGGAVPFSDPPAPDEPLRPERHRRDPERELRARRARRELAGQGPLGGHLRGRAATPASWCSCRWRW